MRFFKELFCSHHYHPISSSEYRIPVKGEDCALNTSSKYQTYDLWGFLVAYSTYKIRCCKCKKVKDHIAEHEMSIPREKSMYMNLPTEEGIKDG